MLLHKIISKNQTGFGRIDYVFLIECFEAKFMSN